LKLYQKKGTAQPDEDVVMRAVPVRLAPDLTVPVVSLPLLLVLKLFAWRERKHEKRDAADIHTLLKQYGDAGSEDRLHGENLAILEAEEFNFEPAGAVLLGLDVANCVSGSTRKELEQILKSDEQMSQLTDQMIALSSGVDGSIATECELLIRKLWQGFFRARD
jgi:predicted nucleotidyltransferase